MLSTSLKGESAIATPTSEALDSIGSSMSSRMLFTTSKSQNVVASVSISASAMAPSMASSKPLPTIPSITTITIYTTASACNAASLSVLTSALSHATSVTLSTDYKTTSLGPMTTSSSKASITPLPYSVPNRNASIILSTGDLKTSSVLLSPTATSSSPVLFTGAAHALAGAGSGVLGSIALLFGVLAL